MHLFPLQLRLGHWCTVPLEYLLWFHWRETFSLVYPHLSPLNIPLHCCCILVGCHLAGTDWLWTTAYIAAERTWFVWQTLKETTTTYLLQLQKYKIHHIWLILLHHCSLVYFQITLALAGHVLMAKNSALFDFGHRYLWFLLHYQCCIIVIGRRCIPCHNVKISIWFHCNENCKKTLREKNESFLPPTWQTIILKKDDVLASIFIDEKDSVAICRWLISIDPEPSFGFPASHNTSVLYWNRRPPTVSIRQ